MIKLYFQYIFAINSTCLLIDSHMNFVAVTTSYDLSYYDLRRVFMNYKTKAIELVKEMTLEEKAGLLSGKDFWHLKGIERL